MATVTAFRAFDMGKIDWSRAFPSSTQVTLAAELTVAGRHYHDAAHSDGGVVAGRDYTLSPAGDIVSGIVQGVFLGDGAPVATDPAFAIQGLTAPLSIFAAATRTASRVDDVFELGELLFSNDKITGSVGDDRLEGFAGNDVLRGGAGNDWLYGDAGNDVFIGGSGRDRMFGGAGDDVYYIDNRHDRIYETVGGDSVVDTGGNDTVHTPFSINLRAYVGLSFVDNVVLEGSDATYASGTSLANTLTGNDSNNVLRGLAGRDTLNGMGGQDTLLGGSDNDRLTGGAGRDVMTGGEGNDVFVFAKGDFAGLTSDTADRIVDFRSTQNDHIDLTALGTGLSFIGTESFHGAAGEVRYQLDPHGALVLGDLDGDGAADFAIRLDAVSALHSVDFIL